MVIWMVLGVHSARPTSVRRRRQAPVPRRRQILVRLTDEEFEDIRRTAETAGLALGAWVGETVVRSIDREEWALGVSRSEVVRQLVRLRLDVAFVLQVVTELGGEGGPAAVTRPLDAVLGRLDELVDRAVDETA
jgi:hypothetical protein